MKAKKNNAVFEERFCKKCGAPLRSANKHKRCDNCRRDRARKIREIGGGLLSLGLLAIPGVKHFIKK